MKILDEVRSKIIFLILFPVLALACITGVTIWSDRQQTGIIDTISNTRMPVTTAIAGLIVQVHEAYHHIMGAYVFDRDTAFDRDTRKDNLDEVKGAIVKFKAELDKLKNLNLNAFESGLLAPVEEASSQFFEHVNLATILLSHNLGSDNKEAKLVILDMSKPQKILFQALIDVGEYEKELNKRMTLDARETLQKDQVIITISWLFAIAGIWIFGTMVSRRLTKQLDQLQDSAKYAALWDMASSIAHEINNPLATIMGRSEIMRSKAEKAELDHEYLVKGLVTIESTSKRIATIVKGLRSLSRNVEKQPFENIKIKDLFETTLSFCWQRFRADGIDFRIKDIPEGTVWCQEVQIAQVLLNLLNNAHDAVCTSSERWVEIGGSLNQGVWKILVTDSGAGIPKAIAKKIMLPFFTTKTRGYGTGLGLSISKSIVEQHGGRLWLNENSSHTQFVVELQEKATVKYLT